MKKRHTKHLSALKILKENLNQEKVNLAPKSQFNGHVVKAMY